LAGMPPKIKSLDKSLHRSEFQTYGSPFNKLKMVFRNQKEVTGCSVCFILLATPLTRRNCIGPAAAGS